MQQGRVMDIHVPEKRLHGQAKLFASVNKTVAAGDGMWREDQRESYFSVGASALAVILEALAAARTRPRTIGRVLDYACGYGRVLRWLRAKFPEAYVLGVDADPKAVQAAAGALGVETRHLDVTLANPVGQPFDLIWVGSLLTHLPEVEAARLLGYLKRHMTPNAVLVFTTHGGLVQERLETGTRTYNLKDDASRIVVEGVSRTGYGFADYERKEGYGISVVTPAKMMSMAGEAGLQPIYFKARGWAAHQDVYGCVLSP